MARHLALDLRLEVAAGDVQRAGQRALLVLVGLADVEQHGARTSPQLVGVGGVDLADLGSWPVASRSRKSPWSTARKSGTVAGPGNPTSWSTVQIRRDSRAGIKR